jgi:hypothetical protein
MKTRIHPFALALLAVDAAWTAGRLSSDLNLEF